MASDENEQEETPIRMKVIGVGGAGGNMVDRLRLSNPAEVQLAAINTDQQALENSSIPEKLCIGRKVTRGLGAGGDPEVGREAALADAERLAEMVRGVDLLFIAAGLGGGVGTGAAPALADLAMREGALVIAFVALPFSIERAARANVAKAGLEQLRASCNAVIPLPNDLLVQEAEEGASLVEAFGKANAWIGQGINSICTMLFRPGLINLDFSQLRHAFARKAGKTLFGLGAGEGPEAAKEALAQLELCPLLHTPEFAKQADQLLVNIIGGPSLGMGDVQRIMERVAEAFGKDANLTMGAVVDEDFGKRVELCVIGASDVFGEAAPRSARQAAAPPADDNAGADEPERPSARPPATRPAKSRTTHPRPSRAKQREFAFSEGDPKGEFENTSGFLFEGQDLDTPTFLRKGVKIPL